MLAARKNPKRRVKKKMVGWLRPLRVPGNRKQG
jgi:hypothetical protein